MADHQHSSADHSQTRHGSSESTPLLLATNGGQSSSSGVNDIPSANLLGFAGQEFARKIPKVAGILIETLFGSIVEIILFAVLIAQHKVVVEEGDDTNGDKENLIPIIQAAILGSILSNLLLCLGLCFFVGGIRQASQKFYAIVSEVGTGLLLVSALGLLIPGAFYFALKTDALTDNTHYIPSLRLLPREDFTERTLKDDVLRISHITIGWTLLFSCRHSCGRFPTLAPRYRYTSLNGMRVPPALYRMYRYVFAQGLNSYTLCYFGAKTP